MSSQARVWHSQEPADEDTESAGGKNPASLILLSIGHLIRFERFLLIYYHHLSYKLRQ